MMDGDGSAQPKLLGPRVGRAELAAIGDEFVWRGRATILIAPSALALTESNWVINTLRPSFSKIKLKPIERFRYDSRFFRS
jgi:hypothetical protein